MVVSLTCSFLRKKVNYFLTIMATRSTENYLKAIYSLSQKNGAIVQTNAISQYLDVKASSITDMLRKLKDSGLIEYEKYKGVRLNQEGTRLALNIIRKHRLWEIFLYEKLQFNWDEVHDVAEQLEHIQSANLVDKLDAFLGFPEVDPHGEPVPNADGIIAKRKGVPLREYPPGKWGTVCGVDDENRDFLNYLDDRDIALGTRLRLRKVEAFDESVEIEVKKQLFQLSASAAERIYLLETDK